MANLSDLAAYYPYKTEGIQNPPRKLGTHLAYQEYVERTLKAGGIPMSAEEYSKKQRE